MFWDCVYFSVFFNMNRKIENRKMGKLRNAGFTLIEMLVSIGIFTLMTSIILANYVNFNDVVALSAAGQEMVLSIRQAQTYALNVSQRSVGSGLFSDPFGIFFDLDDPTAYYIFVDRNANRKYNVGGGCGAGSSDCITKVNLPNGIRINNLCDIVSACPPGLSIRQAHVTFMRPDPDAYIRFTNISGSFVGPAQQQVKIILISPKGTTLNVTIESTGQILSQ